MLLLIYFGMLHFDICMMAHYCEGHGGLAKAHGVARAAVAQGASCKWGVSEQIYFQVLLAVH
jgi:hypothetical protein